VTAAVAGGPEIRPPDEAALHALSVAYADAADRRDGTRFADLFLDDGVLVVPRYPDELQPVVTLAGTDALRRVSTGLMRFERTFHLVANTSFAVEGDRATGEVQCLAHHLVAEDPVPAAGPGLVDQVWFIRYRDDYARIGEGWRFARRVLHLQWVEERAVERVGPPWPPPVDGGSA
jgi:hypothetical protein